MEDTADIYYTIEIIMCKFAFVKKNDIIAGRNPKEHDL